MTISAGLIDSAYLVSFIQRPFPGAYRLSRRLAGLARHSASCEPGNTSVLMLGLHLGLRRPLQGTLCPHPQPGRARCNVSRAARCRAGPGGSRRWAQCFKQSPCGQERRRSQQAQSCSAAAYFPIMKGNPLRQRRRDEGTLPATTAPLPKYTPHALPPPKAEMVLQSLFRSHHLPLGKDPGCLLTPTLPRQVREPL